MIQRQEAILDEARRQGQVAVEALAARFGVSVQTIRKDLNELAERRLVTRVHGGAILASSVENVGYEARKRVAVEEKARIGRAAASLVPQSASLFINIGTTTEAVAQALLQHGDLRVVTNNLNVASLMRPYPNIEVVVASGVVRTSDGGIVGEAAVDFIRQFKVDCAVIGASAIDEEGALLDYDYREVKVAQAILANARRVVLVADASKFERSAPVRIAHLDQIDDFVTDRLPDAIRPVCRTAGTRVVETENAGPRVVGLRRP